MDLKLLDEIIKLNHLNNLKMSQLLKMSNTGFRYKMQGVREFKVSELRKLKKYLNISDATMLKLIFGEDTVPDKYNKELDNDRFR